MILGQESEIGWVGAWAIILFMAAMMIVAGMITVGVARRTADGRTGRNALAGTRTRATMSSDEAWAAAHTAGKRLTEVGGWVAIASGVASVLVAGLSAGLGASTDVTVGIAVAISAGLGTICVLGFVVAGAVKGHRAAVAVRDGLAGTDPLSG